MQRRAFRFSAAERPPATAGAPFGVGELIAELSLAVAHQAKQRFVLLVSGFGGEQLLERVERVVPMLQLHVRFAEEVERAVFVVILRHSLLQNGNRFVPAFEVL